MKQRIVILLISFLVMVGCGSQVHREKNECVSLLKNTVIIEKNKGGHHPSNGFIQGSLATVKVNLFVILKKTGYYSFRTFHKSQDNAPDILKHSFVLKIDTIPSYQQIPLSEDFDLLEVERNDEYGTMEEDAVLFSSILSN